MIDYKENKAQDIKDKEEVFCAEIVVTTPAGKPYYEILYYDLKDSSWHIGYSSYDLYNVIWWRNKYFKIISDISAMRPPKKRMPIIRTLLDFMRRKK